MADARSHGRFEDAEAARAVVGRLNAAAAGDAAAIERDARLRSNVAARPQDDLERAIAAARQGKGRDRRAALVADGLTSVFGRWSGAQFEEALLRLGIPADVARSQLERLVASGHVTEARPGLFAAVPS